MMRLKLARTRNAFTLIFLLLAVAAATFFLFALEANASFLSRQVSVAVARELAHQYWLLWIAPTVKIHFISLLLAKFYALIFFILVLSSGEIILLFSCLFFLLVAIYLLIAQSYYARSVETDGGRDELTQLPNRALFVSRLHQDILDARRLRRDLALVYLDLDHFKNVNDDLGYDVGDQLLLQVIARLHDVLGGRDYIARIGGDAFAVIFKDQVSRAHLDKVAHKIHVAINRPFVLAGNYVSFTLSIGVAIYPDDAANVITLMKHAELALYALKEKGGDGTNYFTQELIEERVKSIRLENALRTAVKHDEFFLVYQPQVNLETKKIVGAEVLLRWHNSQFAGIGPDSFIPVAEKSKVIIQITDWVLQHACLQYADWLERKIIPADFVLAVNISPQRLLAPDFMRRLNEITRKHGIKPAMLELEITETAVVTNITAASSILKQLRDAGFATAVDDYGSGYASLNYLANLPLTKLKIDKMFLDNLEDNQDNRIIIQSTIGLGRDLNVDVIVEGVETAEQVKFLLESGCKLGQGYFFSKPLSEEDFTHYLRSV